MVTKVSTRRGWSRERWRVRLACPHRPRAPTCGLKCGFSCVFLTWNINLDLLLTEGSGSSLAYLV